MSAPEAILTLNAGSSSLKFALFDAARKTCDRRYHGAISDIDSTPRLRVLDDASGEVLHDADVVLPGHGQTAGFLLAWLEAHLPAQTIVAAGHRVVHGGPDHAAPVLLNRKTLTELRRYSRLAPLHMPHNLAAIETIWRRYPGLPQVACFDTAFHRGMTWNEQAWALPRDWFERGVLRYGFHGLSYEYIADALRDRPDIDADSRIVIAHLGHGASLCALRGGRSVATTMGFTPLDGLPMATRPSALDPGLVLWMLTGAGLSSRQVENLLNHRSGLLGLSGISGDVATLLASEEKAATEALDYFMHHTHKQIAAMAATLGGIDALVFTGGIGEKAPAIRAGICERARWLGIELDDDANLDNRGVISTASSPVTVLRIATDEEKMIAQHTRALAVPNGNAAQE